MARKPGYRPPNQRGGASWSPGGGDDDGGGEVGGKAKTQFFAIPKKQRPAAPEPESEPEPAPEPEPAVQGPPPAAGPPMGPPPAAHHPSLQPGFHHHSMPAQPAPAGAQDQSFKLFAIGAALMMFLGSGGIILLGGVVALFTIGPLAKSPSSSSTTPTEQGADTGRGGNGFYNADPSMPKKGGGKGGGGKKPADDGEGDAPAAAPVTSGPLTVQVPPDATFKAVELMCDGQEMQRGAFDSKNKAHFVEVPLEANCLLTFRGGIPAKWRGAHGGQTLRCTFMHKKTNCR